ncbi:uncharacterized protein LOC107869524 isoform X2 [Capsicum annuum]|uniref:uncharacterized protein LOC107869524 isoform X2 n=1 Tax=Capsicum annuum TaxID=4072 RepID=UPI0007BFB7A6|nr:uncharacterized protein LOC107869524 isoform X2 [Capsicum annuum]XP_016571541.1 uncharacterized protein LOC107869524 isoform X2 [Capsicum annuum]XP_047266912.1 uncharacterized protein LOC107869524 isoform X2 [Capsicum annuum]
MDEDDDFGYEIGQDDLREKSKQYRNYDDFFYEIGYDFSSKSSKQYYRNDDDESEEECKILRDVLNKLDCKLSLLKSVKWTKPNATLFDAAESMKEMLDEILKMKDAYDKRCEEENVQKITEKDAVEKTLKDDEQQFDEENVQTMTDVEAERDAVQKNLKDDEQKIDAENVQKMTGAETEKDVEKNLKDDKRKIDGIF